MKNQELAFRITQLEVLVKETTDTLTRGLNQLFMLMNELLQDHSKQPYRSELDEAKSQGMGNQSSMEYNLLEFIKSLIIWSTIHR